MLFEALPWVLFREKWAVSTNGKVQLSSTRLGQERLSGSGGIGCKPRTSELLDRRFRFHQDRNAIANGINALALVALKTVLAAQNQRLATDWARNDFQQLRAYHNYEF
jgi:hypothetical protein